MAVLILDDFGTQSSTAWAQEKLFQIINHRYISQLPTVITTNYRFNDFEGRIRSRLTDPEIVTRVDILAPDYRNPTDEVGHPELSTLNLHNKQQFDTFSLRANEPGMLAEDKASLKHALDIAQAYAKNPQGWLLFQGGPYACGKTHLAAAIGNYQAALGAPPLLWVCPICWIICARLLPQTAHKVWTSALMKSAQRGCLSLMTWTRSLPRHGHARRFISFSTIAMWQSCPR